MQTTSNTSVETIKPRMQKLMLFAIVSCCAAFGSLIAFVTINSLFQFYLFKVVQLLLFVALGLFYKNFQLKYHSGKSSSLKENIIQEAIIIVAVCIISGIIYFINDRSLLIMSLSSAAAFALPLVTYKCWLLFNKIPEKEFKIWVPEKRTENNASIFLDSLYIKLKLAKKYYDSEDEVYNVYMPYYVKLGEFFSRFINEKNRKQTVIEDKDFLKKLYAWEFFAADKYGLQIRRLDPNKNIAGNKLRRSSVILAKRAEPIKLLTYEQA